MKKVSLVFDDGITRGFELIIRLSQIIYQLLDL